MEIDIALDNYDDIFSDFDIREYEERAISADFLYEILSRLRNKKAKKVKILLTVPKAERNKRIERVIKRRLKQFFREKLKEIREKEEETRKKGFLFIVVGIFILLLALALERLFPEWIAEFLFIPSWFFTWNGLDKLFNVIPSLEKKRKYYSLLANAKISFEDEEEFYEE